MSSFRLIPLLVAASQAATLSAAGLRREGRWLEARGEEPAFDADEGAPEGCTFWYDSAAALGCDALAIAFSVSVEDLVAWNPSLDSSCELQPDHSYCVEVESATTPDPSESESPSPTGGDDGGKETSTPTSPDEGTETPINVQPGMVESCDAFYLVEAGDSCADIASDNGVSVAVLVEWNPAIGSACKNMWANYYLCVSVEGQDADEPPIDDEPSPTGEPGPTPTQPGTVDDCDEFHQVEEGDICGDIVEKYDISLDDFLEWNTNVGGRACTGLWLDYYVCVGIAD